MQQNTNDVYECGLFWNALLDSLAFPWWHTLLDALCVMTWGEWHRPVGTADLLMCQEMILDHWAMTTLVAECQEEEMVQKLPQLKGLLSISFGKTLYLEAGVSFKVTRLLLQPLQSFGWLYADLQPSSVFRSCPSMPSRSYTRRFLHTGSFSFFFPFCWLVNTFF